jgi:flavin reductase (DIM6/NTAB) family NADH-FMN oxidoreductase RutF
MSSKIDQRAFRDALGQFATGVTIVTTLDASGEAVGMTVSSFNSVSLNPPLVLWSIDRSSHSFDTFMQADRYVVHVLNQTQKELCMTFATPGADKFSAAEFERSAHNIPMLTSYLARFECKTAHQYDGGDHVILVGEAELFDVQGGDPLIFHRGDLK